MSNTVAQLSTNVKNSHISYSMIINNVEVLFIESCKEINQDISEEENVKECIDVLIS